MFQKLHNSPLVMIEMIEILLDRILESTVWNQSDMPNGVSVKGMSTVT